VDIAEQIIIRPLLKYLKEQEARAIDEELSLDKYYEYEQERISDLMMEEYEAAFGQDIQDLKGDIEGDLDEDI
jgi:hypothetical protein